MGSQAQYVHKEHSHTVSCIIRIRWKRWYILAKQQQKRAFDPNIIFQPARHMPISSWKK